MVVLSHSPGEYNKAGNSKALRHVVGLALAVNESALFRVRTYSEFRLWARV
jgi:hypothetical protein